MGKGSGCISSWSCFCFEVTITLPETNSEFTPKNGWLEYDSFLLGWPIFRGELLVLGRVGQFFFGGGDLTIESNDVFLLLSFWFPNFQTWRSIVIYTFC